MPDLVDQTMEVGVASSFQTPLMKPSNNNCGLFSHVRGTNVCYGDVNQLPAAVKVMLEEAIALCQPEQIHICDGSELENTVLLRKLLEVGTIQALPKYENCWLARTNPADVARVESKTFICTEQRSQAIPDCSNGALGNWISNENMQGAIQERFPGCMKGRTMYVIAFSMGPVGSELSKLGVQITDSAYVVASMRIMTRIGQPVWQQLRKGLTFVKALHSVGKPVSGVHAYPAWPCDPERTIILHKPADNLIVSYGSGYGGNSLLGKKCFALRLGSIMAQQEGWLAEHMLILGITNPAGKKFYIAAAFPSACGKTNLAMLQPTLPGYKIECVGDDIAWMRFDKFGVLRAINPEYGFFGVAPGTGNETNPIAMKTVFKNTIFTNVAATSDGGVYWEGMESSLAPDVQITDWLGNAWTKASGKPAAHPNSRFCTPAAQCPIIDAQWESAEGVPISAILFGGRRPEGVPLIYESFNWAHGVFVGASMRSEATAAAEHQGKAIMHDPFAMRPFFGYNFGNYLTHWLSMQQRGKVPKIFHVNWFRKSSSGQFLWPGFGENIRVLDWIVRRVQEENCFENTVIGRIPSVGALNLDGLSAIDTKQLFSIDKKFWQQEIQDIEFYFNTQVGVSLPETVRKELLALKERVSKL